MRKPKSFVWREVASAPRPVCDSWTRLAGQGPSALWGHVKETWPDAHAKLQFSAALQPELTLKQGNEKNVHGAIACSGSWLNVLLLDEQEGTTN